MRVSTVQTTSLPQRLSVIGLMLLLHFMLWLAWQAQNKLKLAQEDRTFYLHMLQIPSQEANPKPSPEKISPPRAKSSTSPHVATRKALVSDTNSVRATSEPITMSPHDGVTETPMQREPEQRPETSTHLDWDALHQSAMMMEKQRKHSEIEKIQDGLKRDESFEKQLGEGVKKAQAKDCRQAYSGLGLLAIIPLAASAVSDKVCKW